ncbi:uncharacterized protein LOC129919305 [Episyrphus balteatus]|uniref:uncharacterized protein LOC129919305 n=1 Tax=Episyrphus balteatus TaxID=286459 RepID=UPI00248637A3|nr:uncharacterized protein LOC129919305 [Episyrphus balteatus]
MALKSIDNIALIRQVKEHPILFNASGGGKLNATLRTEAWESVWFPVSIRLTKRRKRIQNWESKKKWKSLRDTFRRFLRKLQSGATKMSPQNMELEFLVPYIMNESGDTGAEGDGGDQAGEDQAWEDQADTSDDSEETCFISLS